MSFSHMCRRLLPVAAGLSAIALVGCARELPTLPAAIGLESRAAGRFDLLPPTVVYGPATFTRTTGKPRVDGASFNATAGDALTIVVSSSSSQGLNATITLNGTVVLDEGGASDVPVTIAAVAQATNVLQVRLTGKPGSSVTIVASVPTALPAAGLVLHYPLDGNGNDVSGSGIDATITNGEYVADRHGVANAAFHVPTNNAWGIAPFGPGSPISFATSAQFSASMWVRADSLPSNANAGLFFNVGVSDFGWAFGVRQGGASFAQVCTPNDFCFSTEANAGDVPNGIAPGQWVHLTLLYDGVAHRLTYYLNGQRAGYVEMTLSPHTTDTEVWFGTAPMATQYWSRASLDEIRVYNRLLTPSEIAQLATY